ncbi:MAG: hypothetical protein WBB19_10515 [Desulforhopalus sp.]
MPSFFPTRFTVGIIASRLIAMMPTGFFFCSSRFPSIHLNVSRLLGFSEQMRDILSHEKKVL